MMDIKVFEPKDFPAYLPRLNQLYDDLFDGGKGFRARLVQMVSETLDLPQRSTQLLMQTIEFIHNASLLHDDLVDRSKLRRGKTAMWLKYSPEYAVLAGDYLLARVMVNLSSYGNIRLVQYTAEMISDLLEGEWLQDSVVGDFFISVDQLDRIHNLKTASLFKWCLRAPFIAQENYKQSIHEILVECGTLLGQLFQRSDDLLDFNVRNYEGKAILGDLKSSYLNSFGAFLCEDLTKEQINQLARSHDLEQVYISVGGKEVFAKKLANFDEKNKEIIFIYEHLLKKLNDELGPRGDVLIEKLRKLPHWIYWRSKNP